jgi:hypothetical protein
LSELFAKLAKQKDKNKIVNTLDFIVINLI